MMQKPAFFSAVGVAALLAGAVTWASHTRRLALMLPAPPPPVSAGATPVAPVTGQEVARTVADAAPAVEENTIPPLPADATHVPDEYLLKLSAMVNLANAEEHRIDKDQWSRAVPIAERLAQAPCDCEQRNWLNHFVEMGRDAMDGSDEEYYRLAGRMRKMARNDKQLTDHAFTN